MVVWLGHNILKLTVLHNHFGVFMWIGLVEITSPTCSLGEWQNDANRLNNDVNRQTKFRSRVLPSMFKRKSDNSTWRLGWADRVHCSNFYWFSVWTNLIGQWLVSFSQETWWSIDQVCLTFYVQQFLISLQAGGDLWLFGSTKTKKLGDTDARSGSECINEPMMEGCWLPWVRGLIIVFECLTWYSNQAGFPAASIDRKLAAFPKNHL